MGVKVECFGEPVIALGRTRLKLNGQQPITLAALVAAGPEGTTKSRLYNELFGDDPQASGEQAVVMRVQRLRKKLREVAGSTQIITSGRRIGIDPEVCSVDVWDFDESIRSFSDGWQHVLGQWAEPYRGLRSLPDSVLLSAERLRNTYRSGLSHVGWTIEAGSTGDLIEQIAHEIENDPFNEQLATSHAVALYRTGRQPEALETLDALRSRLLEGHGLNPGAGVDRIQHAILTNNIDPVPNPKLSSAPEPASPTLHAPNRFRGRAALVARLEQQLTALGAATGAQGRIELIVGPGGSGKSTLLAKVLAPLDREAVALRLGSALPDGGQGTKPGFYQPFVEAFPELEAQLRTHASGGEIADEAFWDIVQRVIQDAASSRPTVVVLENMHDADSTAVGLLRFLAGASLHPRLLIFVTTREPVPETPWHRTFDTLAANTDRVSIHALEPLTLEDVQSFVETDHPLQPLVVRERFARRLLDVSGGNALVATALSRDAPADLDIDLLPGALDPEDAYFDYVSHRIEGRELEQILWVASMIGLEFESALIEEVLDLDKGVVEHQLERFTRLHLGHRVDERHWRFDHLLTLNSIARRARPMRPLLLARLARAGTDNPLRMLRYVQGAGKELAVGFRIDQLTWVARVLEQQGAYDEAARASTLLGELSPSDGPARLEALIAAAGALSRVGRRDRAAEIRTEAAQLAKSLGDYQAVFRCALAGLPSGEYAGGEQHRLAMLMGMTLSQRKTVSPLEYAKWTLRLARISDDTDVASSSVESIDLTWPGTIEERASLELERLSFEAQRHDPRRAHREMQDLCEICPEGVERSDLLHRTTLAGLIEQEPAEALRTAVAGSAAYARTNGTPRTRWSSDVLASTLATVGLIDSAASSSSARTSGHRWGIPDVEDNYFVQTFFELWVAGDVGLAQSAIDAVRDRIAMNVAWHGALCLSAAVNGDMSRWKSEATTVTMMLDDRPDGMWAPVAAALLAEASSVAHDADSAARAAAALRPRSGLAIVVGIGSAHLGPVDRYLGLAASVAGDPDSAALFDRAAEQAERSGVTLWAHRARENTSRLCKNDDEPATR